MSTFSFNGWPGFAMPTTPVPASIEWNLDDVIGANVSSFSRQQQAQDWQQSQLKASLGYSIMSEIEFNPWAAFLAQLRGIQGIFLFGDPRRTSPLNSGATGGTVTGSGQTGYTLVTSSSNLSPSDWFQIGLRLYRVTSVSGGTLGIWPCIRESPANGASLIVTNPVGMFRLTKNQRGYKERPGGIYQVAFEIEEAL